MRCPRCGSADLAVNDAADDRGFRIICYTCGNTWYSMELT